MTDLKKPIKRISSGVVRECGQVRPIVITLVPPDVLLFRAKGCRKSYALTANVCYTMAVRAEAERKRRDKQSEKKTSRKVNRGCL